MNGTPLTADERRRAVTAITTIVFVDALGLSLVLPFLPLYARHAFGASSVMIGLIIATFAVFQLISAPIIGRLSDIYGRKPVLLITLLGSALGFLVLGSAQWVTDSLEAQGAAFAMQAGLLTVFLARAINGITGGNMPVAQAFLADVTDEDSRAHAMGAVTTAFAAALAIGPLLAGHMASGDNFTIPALVGAFASLLGALLCWLTLPDPARMASLETHGEDAVLHEQSQAATPARMPEIRAALRQRRTALLLIEWFLFILCFAMFAPMFPLFAEEEFGLTTRQIGLMLATVAVLAIVWQVFILGPLSTRLRDKQLGILGLTSYMACFVILGVYNDIGNSVSMVSVTSLMLLFGLGFAAARPAITSALTKVVIGSLAGGILGVAQSFDSLATIIGPVLTGWLLDSIGLHALGWTAAGFTAIALAVAWLAPST